MALSDEELDAIEARWRAVETHGFETRQAAIGGLLVHLDRATVGQA